MSRRIFALLPLLTLACSANPAPSSTARGSGGSMGSGGTVSIIGTGGTDLGTGGSVSVIGGCTSACTDFPTQTQLDGAATPDMASKFGDANAGGPTADCITEPTDGALVPRNWWRPRIHFTPQAGETLFEIRIHADIEKNDLLVYTTKNSYLVPADAWQGVAAHAAGSALTVTVRGTSASGGAVSKATSKLNIAPVDAGGAMVYWATTSVQETMTASKLVGFKVGEEGTVDALHIADVKESNLFNEAGAQKPTPPVSGGAPAGAVSCIGCHTSTPDGSAVAFKDGWPWAGIVSSIEKDTVGQRPSYVTDVGARDMQQPFIGTFTFSAAFWTPTSHLGVSVYSEVTSGIPTGGSWTGANRNIVTASDVVWLELSAPGTMPTDGASVNTAVLGDKGTTWGLIPRTGDTRAAVMPDWSHDGKTIAYTSTDQIAGGHVGGLYANDDAAHGVVGGVTPLPTATESDIYTVPFNNKMGGAATPVSGAASAGVAEYYPDFSADDQFIAYNRVNSTIGYFYYRRDGEIAIIPAAGGMPTRLKANDPAACSGETSPGVLNSWPKWSPSVETDATGNKYYFLVFSSARHYDEQFQLAANQYTPPGTDARSSQMYLAAIMVSPTGAITDYPAVYIWNQTPMTSNLTPAWDEFKIPEVVVK